MAKEISKETQTSIKNALSNCEKFDIDFGNNQIFKGNYCPKNGLFLIEAKSYDDAKFIQEIPHLKDTFINKIKSHYPNVDASQVFLIDYSGTIAPRVDLASKGVDPLPGYEVMDIDINMTLDSITNVDNSKYFKTFEEFKQKHF